MSIFTVSISKAAENGRMLNGAMVQP